MAESKILLEIKNLVTEFKTDDGITKAVNDISFTLNRGETIGIVGESGSGKSVTSLSIMRLIPDPPGRIASGEINCHDISRAYDIAKPGFYLWQPGNGGHTITSKSFET